MKCAYCRKPVKWWQSKRPLVGGLLPDSFGQFEHSDCQLERFELIWASHESLVACLVANKIARAALHPEAEQEFDETLGDA